MTTLTISQTPYGFVEAPGVTHVRLAPESIGVYLWCLEYEGGYLVNYVGKASGQRGFRGRLVQEDKDYRANRYLVRVDIDLWIRGIRREVQGMVDQEYHERRLRETYPRYRILLVPLGSECDVLLMESTFVNLLRRHPATNQFISNRDRHTAYKRCVPVQFAADSPKMYGLTADVPASLVQALELKS